MWVATHTDVKLPRYIRISTHATHEGGDADGKKVVTHPNISTHATHKGGDTYLDNKASILHLFQLSPPMRVATLGYCIYLDIKLISTHATHEGGDNRAVLSII